MAQADGSVVVEVNLDTSKTDKEIAKLKKEIAKLEESASTQESKKDPLVKQAEQLRQKIKDAQKDVEKFGREWVNGITGADREQSGAIAKVAQLEAEYQSVVAQIDKIDQKLMDTYSAIERNKIAAGELAQELSGSSGQTGTAGAVDTSSAEQAATKMESIFSRIKALASEGLGSVRLGLTGIADGFRSLGSRISSAMKSGLSSISKFIKSGLQKLISLAGKAAKSMLPFVKNSNSVGSSFASNLKTMLRYTLGLRGLYSLFSRARTAMVEGFHNLAQYSESTNASISMLKSALTQLKNSLATAFAPILNVVAPIITKFINMLSSAANAVARLTAMLTGQTSYVKAIAVQEDYAASLEDTASAADDAAGSLASFDEINTITTENTAGASGGSGGTSADQMFETVEVEPFSFDSWGEAFSAMLDSIIENGIPRLKSALSSLANWINTFSKNLYEMFTFPGVYDKVVLLGAELANALNDLVNDIDWATLGAALGAGLNLALGFLVSFIYTFDWINLGSSLATMINNAIAEIDWYNVGMLLWAKFKIALETLAGFLLNLDMVQLAQAASNIIMGFFDSMTQSIQNVDWQALGTQIGTFISNIDWIGILTSVGSAIVAAIPAALELVTGFIEGLSPEVLGAIAVVVAGVIAGVPTLISSIGTAIATAITSWPVVIAAALVLVAATVTGHADELIASVKEILQGFLDFLTDVFSGDLEGAVEALGNIFGGLTDLFDAVIASVRDLFLGFLDWLDEKTGGQFSGIIETIKGLVSSAFEFISETFGAISETVSDVLGGIITFISGVFTGDWEKAWDGVSSVFKGIWNGIVSVLESAVNLIIKGINWLISQLNKVSFTLPSWVPVIGGKSFGFNIPSISEISIPRLAQGTVVPPNREFMAVLGDNKQETEVVSPLSTMKQAMIEAMQEAGFGNETIEVKLMIDGKQLARNQVKRINELTQQAGRSVLLV